MKKSLDQSRKIATKESKQNWDRYKLQIICLVDLLRKTKTKFFENLKVRAISSNKTRDILLNNQMVFGNEELNCNKLCLFHKADVNSSKEIQMNIFSNFFVNTRNERQPLTKYLENL